LEGNSSFNIFSNSSFTVPSRASFGLLVLNFAKAFHPNLASALSIFPQRNIISFDFVDDDDDDDNDDDDDDNNDDDDDEE